MLAVGFSHMAFIMLMYVSSMPTKLSLFADDMILYIEGLKDPTRKLLVLINEFGKVARHKINIQKCFAFLYINNELSEREIKKTILFAITSKRIKYLGMNLPKKVKDLTWKTIRH